MTAHNDATRDGDHRHGFMTDDEVVDKWTSIIGAKAFTVLGIILRHFNSRDRKSIPSVPVIAQKADISERQVYRELLVLYAHNMILKWKDGKHNAYRPLHPRYWRENTDATPDKEAGKTLPGSHPNHIGDHPSSATPPPDTGATPDSSAHEADSHETTEGQPADDTDGGDERLTPGEGTYDEAPADTEEEDEDDEALGERLKRAYEQEAIELGYTLEELWHSPDVGSREWMRAVLRLDENDRPI